MLLSNDPNAFARMFGAPAPWEQPAPPAPVMPPAMPGPARFGNIIEQVEQANTALRPASSFDPNNMNPDAIAALARLEQMAGQPFRINSAYRDPARNASAGGARYSQHMQGTAFDIDVRDMPVDQRVELIRQAREAGFGGVGVYNNSLHFDTGPTRHWGPDFRSGSLPGWAAEAVGAPRTGNPSRPQQQAQQGGSPAQAQQTGQTMAQAQPAGLLGFMSAMNEPERSRRPSIWDRLEGKPLIGGLSDADTRARLSIAMQGMTMNPNMPLVSMLQDDMQDRRDTRRDDRRMQQAAMWLESMGRPELAAAVLSGVIGGDQAAAIAMAPPAPPPASYEALRLQAIAGGLEEGTPEFQQFMLQGGDMDGASNNVRASQILADGTTVQSTDMGVRVYHPARGELFGKEAEDAIAEANRQRVEQERAINEGRRTGTLQADIGLGGEAAATVDGARAAVNQGQIAYDAFRNVSSNLNNIDRAIEALDSGAETGMVYNMLPNITVASAELQNAMDSMGLDIIGAVTFGALSEPEMRLAMETAAPRNLPPAELRQWLVDRRDAQAKVAETLQDAAVFLMSPGNTIPMWIERNRAGQGQQQAATPPPAAGQQAATQQPAAAPQASAYTGPAAAEIAAMTPEEYAQWQTTVDLTSLPDDILEAMLGRQR